MLVFGAGDAVGSIGGGRLEWLAMAHAVEMLDRSDRDGAGTERREWGLGPVLGQCCGGRVRVAFERTEGSESQAWEARLSEQAAFVHVFGAGHVGMAIHRAAQDLPLAVTLLDSRPECQWQPAQTGVDAEAKAGLVSLDDIDWPEDAVPDLPAGGAVLVMTHSHAEDFDIMLALLTRQASKGDLPFIGLIGSRSKWQGFRRRLSERGVDEAVLDQVHCPIGLPGVRGKSPGVVAAAVVAQLLSVLPQEST
ncbi:xanthine dehydrogenase accessory protein XdhC [Hydrogenophaga sp. 5NK40-0174]